MNLQPGSRKNNEIILQGFCFDHPVNYMLDTGANVSLVSSRLVDVLDLWNSIRPTSTIISGLDSKTVPTKGEISLPFKLGPRTYNHVFIVCDTVDTEFLFGMDVMQQLSLSINIGSGMVKLANSSIPFIRKPKSLNRRLKVRCLETVILPANTGQFIQGKIPNNDSSESRSNYEGMLMPYHNFVCKTGVFVTGTLNYTTGALLPIHVINANPFNVTLYKHQLVGFLEPFQKPPSPSSVRKVKGNPKFYDADIELERLPTADSVEETIKKGKWDRPLDLIKRLKIDEIDISPEEKHELKSLIIDYSHVFSRNKHDLGLASFYEAELNLKKDYTPKWVPTRQVSYLMRPHMDKEIENLSKSGQIKPCRYSLWNNAVFMVEKSNGSFRFIVDARSLNKQCVQDNYELNNMKHVLDNLRDKNWISSFDFSSSFHQVGLKDDSQPLTAFTWNGKRYQFSRMIQGQTSSSASFSRAIGQLFANVPFTSLLLYIDDLLLGSATISEHMKRLRFIFDRLTFGNFKLNPEKTQLFKQEVTFLGCRVGRNGIDIDPTKLEPLANLRVPTSVKDVQSFIGSLNFFRAHISKFSWKAAPLYRLLQKGVKFHWSTDCQQAFDDLKSSLTTAPVLAIPDIDDPNSSYEVTIDSSKMGHAGVLTQFIEGERRVISYFSKSIKRHMQKYGASRLEFLGLCEALDHWKLYLLGAKTFLVKTDCSALLNMDTIFNKENSFIQRKLLILSKFKFRIEHISGKSADIQIADFLSRYPFEHSKNLRNSSTQTMIGASQTNLNDCKLRIAVSVNDQDVSSCEKADSESSESGQLSASQSSASLPYQYSDPYENEVRFSDLPLSSQQTLKIRTLARNAELNQSKAVTMDDIRSEYANDNILIDVIQWVESGAKSPDINPRQCHKETWFYWRKFDLLQFKNGILRMKIIVPENRANDYYAVIVPYSLISRILYQYHDSMSTCHAGVSKSIDHCARSYYFYGMKREFRLYIAACLTCNRTKQTHAFLRAPLRPIHYHHFGQGIAIDHLEPTKTPTPRGHVALLTITDMFSSFVVCVPVKSTSTEETIRVLMDRWFTIFGFCEGIHHDLGSGFTSYLFKAMTKVYGIQDLKSTSFKSSSQGHVEAANKRLNTCFRAVLENNDIKNYDLYVKYISLTLNSLKSERTGQTPNYLAFGREVTMPRDLIISDSDRVDALSENMKSKELAAYDMYVQVRNVTRKVIDVTKRQSKFMANQYDKKCRGPFFSENDWCMLLVNTPANKYSPKWEGPFQIKQRLSDWNYIIEKGGSPKTINIGKMKHYFPNKYTAAEFGGSAISTNEVISTDKAIRSDRKLPDKKASSKNDWVIIGSDDDDDEDNTIVTISLPKPKWKESASATEVTSQVSSPVPQGTIESRNERSDHLNTAPSDSGVEIDPVDEAVADSAEASPIVQNADSREAENSGQVTSATSNASNVVSTGTDSGEASASSSLTGLTPGRSRSLPNIPTPSRDSETPRSEKTRYNLRKQPKPVKRYGSSAKKSPIKSLMDKFKRT